MSFLLPWWLPFALGCFVVASAFGWFLRFFFGISRRASAGLWFICVLVFGGPVTLASFAAGYAIFSTLCGSPTGGGEFRCYVTPAVAAFVPASIQASLADKRHKR
jgi:hypothetical protein